MPNTTNPWANENPENVTQNRDSELNYLKELSKKQAKTKLSWNDSGENVKNIDFYNNFFEKKYNQDTFFNDFKESLSWEDLKSLLRYQNDNDAKKALFEMFNNEANKIWYKFETKREELRKVIKDRYDLQNVFRDNTEKDLKKLSFEDINKLVQNPDELQKFINKTTKNSTPRKDEFKTVKELFENLSFSSSAELKRKIKAKIEQNNELWTLDSVMWDLNTILTKIKSWENLNSIDIEELFSYGIFTDEQKKAFIKIYLPSISLQELVELDLISQTEADSRKIKQLKSFLAKKRQSSAEISDDDWELKSLNETIDLWNIFVSSKDFLDSWLVKLEKSESLKSNIYNSFNEFKEKVKDEFISKIKTVDVFKEKVSNNPGIVSKLIWGKATLDKLQKWTVLTLWNSQDNRISYFEIVDLWIDGKMTIKNRSSFWNYDSTSSIPINDLNYIDLYNWLDKNKDINKINVLTKEELDEKIKVWEIKQVSQELWEITPSDKFSYEKYIDNEIQKLEFKHKDKDELEKNPEYQHLQRIKNKLQAENYLDDHEIKEELDFFKLLEKIDEADLNWKEFWFKTWVSFKLEDWAKEESFNVYTIHSIDKLNKKVVVVNWNWKLDEWTYDDFFNFFKQFSPNVKRFSYLSSFSNFTTTFSTNQKISSYWSKFDIKDWKIVSKDKENKANYEYLTQFDDWKWAADRVLKLWKIHWVWKDQMVEVQFWNIKEVEKDKKAWKKDKKDEKQEYYELERTPTLMSVAALQNYIDKYNLYPETKEKDKIPSDIPKWDVQWKFSLKNWFFSNKSVREILGWLKMWLDQFKEHLKTWNEEHMAKVALTTWWKFMPTEVKIQLTSRVETSQKKLMDDAIARLKWVDTPYAIKLIYERLKNTNTEEYRKEAWMMFMLEKYGTLYNKNYDDSPLNNQKWSFLWFRAMTWRRNKDIRQHPVYKKHEDDCKKVDEHWRTKNFTEEDLIWLLMKKQCSANGYDGIKRRSRLHKDVEKFKKQWIDDELADWDKKWKETRNPQEIRWKAKGEMMDWSPANWVWLWKTLVDRWDDMFTLNEVPFIMLMSWLVNTLSDHLTNTIKSYVESDWRLVFLARFLSYPEEVKLAQNTMLILCQKIEERYPDKYSGMWSGCKKLFDDMLYQKWTEKERMKNCEKFFDDFWKPLTRAMYMLADWKDEDINSILFIERKNNSILSKYYDTLKMYLNTTAVKDDYLSDAFAQVWLSAIWSKIPWKALWQTTSWWFQNENTRIHIIAEIKKEIEAIKTRNYKFEPERRERLKYYLQTIFSWIVAQHQTNMEKAHFLFEDYWDLNFFNKNRWITTKLLPFSSTEIENMQKDSKCDLVFESFVTNILENKWWESNVWHDVFNILGQAKADDYDMQKAA